MISSVDIEKGGNMHFLRGNDVNGSGLDQGLKDS